MQSKLSPAIQFSSRNKCDRSEPKKLCFVHIPVTDCDAMSFFTSTNYQLLTWLSFLTVVPHIFVLGESGDLHSTAKRRLNEKIGLLAKPDHYLQKRDDFQNTYVSRSKSKGG